MWLIQSSSLFILDNDKLLSSTQSVRENFYACVVYVKILYRQWNKTHSWQNLIWVHHSLITGYGYWHHMGNKGINWEYCKNKHTKDNSYL